MNTVNAIAEPNRRLLMETIRKQPSTVGMLVEVAKLSQPAVSKHLRILKQANLVTVRPDGQRRWYEINPQPLIEVDEFLEPYREFLNDKLDKLEQHLDAMDQ